MKTVNQDPQDIREIIKGDRNRRVNSYYKDASVGEHSSKTASTAPLLYIWDIHKAAEEGTMLDSIFPSELPSTFRTIIVALSGKDGITQLDLTHATGLKPPTISIALQKMEKEKLIFRVTDKHDARALRVYLDEKGQCINRAFRAKLKAIESSLLVGFDDYEINTLNALLRRMYENTLPEEALSKGTAEKVY